jgi:hypothetical protein
MITTFAAFFAFGYCVTDIILRYRANKRIEKFVNDLDNKCNYDD